MSEMQPILQTLNFPSTRKEDWREALPRKIINLQPGIVVIDCLDWVLNCKDFQYIQSLIGRAQLEVKIIEANVPETIVSASALGYPTLLKLEKQNKGPNNSTESNSTSYKKPDLLFHQGTLRSGENLEGEGDLLLLGDVNPGAKVSAGGNVMIWGKLRGTAHAGKSGNNHAKIVALQLRPLQLRIGEMIARGPEEKPQEGLAEEALIESGSIVIKPANPNTLREGYQIKYP